MSRRALTDAHWAIIEPFCLGKQTDPGQTGRDPRLFMETVLWIVRTGAQWRELPAEFGQSWQQSFGSDEHQQALEPRLRAGFSFASIAL